MTIQLEGRAQDVIQAMLEAQIATQLLTMKALVDHGVVDGGALLSALGKISGAMPNAPASIIDFMGKNIEAHINNQNPPPFALTVIDGGKE